MSKQNRKKTNSLSKLFNRKVRALIAAGAIALGGIAGFVGHEIAQQAQPQVSEFTLAQLPDSITEQQFNQQFKTGKLLTGIQVSQETIKAQAQAVDAFTSRISVLAKEHDRYQALVSEGNRFRAEGAEERALEKDREALSQKTLLIEHAVSFVNDLRISPNLSERNYTDLVNGYNSRIGMDVTQRTGNWQKGIMFQQESNLRVRYVMGSFFGGVDDEDHTSPQRMSREVGEAMQKAQQRHDMAGVKGAAAGGALSGLMLAPLWLRIRRNQAKPG